MEKYVVLMYNGKMHCIEIYWNICYAKIKWNYNVDNIKIMATTL